MTYALVPSDMSAASAAVSGAAGDARAADGADALATLGAALPGSSVASYLPELGGLWADGIGDWAADVAAFGAGLDGASADGMGTDSGNGGFFDRLLGGS